MFRSSRPVRAIVKHKWSFNDSSQEPGSYIQLDPASSTLKCFHIWKLCSVPGSTQSHAALVLTLLFSLLSARSSPEVHYPR